MKTRAAVLCVAAKAFEINEDTRVMKISDNLGRYTLAVPRAVLYDPLSVLPRPAPVGYPRTRTVHLDLEISLVDFRGRIGYDKEMNVLIVSKITEVKK